MLPVVELGFRGAQDDHDENTAEAHEAARDIAKLKAGLVDQLALLREAAAADPGGDLNVGDSIDDSRICASVYLDAMHAQTRIPTHPVR